MGRGVSCVRHRRRYLVFISVCTLASATQARAQSTTQVLSAPDTQLVDAMIRNGQYAWSNSDTSVLLTRWSTVPEWERRTVLGIDTSSIPAGSRVTSAVLTLTVRTGLGAAGTTRPVTAYRLTSSFVERQVTWLNRQTATPWETPGGDLGQSYATVMVPNTAGARISFDVTGLVQLAVNGDGGSRQARIALVDVGLGGDVKESYREYHSSESSTTSRPQLTVVYGTAAGSGTIDVPAGGDLQQALNDARPGMTIRLAAGATYIGNFVLPAKGGTQFIVLTTSGATLPAQGTRIDPSYRASLATIRSANEYAALSTASAASYYRIVGLAFESNVNGAGDIIALGSHTQTTLAQVPHHIEIDRVLITGDAAVGQKRGISANAAHVSITNSDVRGIKAIGQDSQAICGWNTPGPITIVNNRLEAAGENIMFGGASLQIPGVIPSDIRIEGNLLTKDVLWRGTSWTVKNIFELKNARRVLVRSNVLEHNWAAAQTGFAVVLTPRNSGGSSPWAVVEDVEFTRNVVRYSGSAFNILGHDDTARSGQLARLTIRDNVVHDISSTTWGGAGAFTQIGGEPRDITIDHNTVMHNGNIVTFYSGSYIDSSGTRVTGGPVAGFVFTNNLLKHNAYGMFGSGQAYGNGTLNYYTVAPVVRRNVFATDRSIASRYPADNFFPTVAAFMETFVNPAVKDYRLVAWSPYRGAGTDGTDLGAR